MQEMLLVAEDRRFYQHSGVDWRAFVAALWQNLWYDHKRGASTSACSLPVCSTPRCTPPGGGRAPDPGPEMGPDLRRPGAGGVGKEQILEAYLPNLVHFRGNLQGIAAASLGLFQKLPSELKRPEAAILAALLRAPNARPALVERRACELLQRVGARIECASMRLALAKLDHGMLAPRWNAAGLLARRLQMRPGDRLRFYPRSCMAGGRAGSQQHLRDVDQAGAPMLRYRSWWSTVPTPA